MNAAEQLMSSYDYLTYKYEPLMPEHQAGLIIGKTVYLRPGQSSELLAQTVSEEIGHYLTSVGDISDTDSPEHRKQEEKARDVGATLVVTPEHLLECFEAGLATCWECAEYLEVPLETLQRAVSVYAKSNNGKLKYNHYTFYFNADGTINIIDWLN